ncbi:MAG: beta-lactamase family protein [Gammaproteobacteria bacterium]|nr:beta-lactamase family protein [Gammaproteobacteria bacterium]
MRTTVALLTALLWVLCLTPTAAADEDQFEAAAWLDDLLAPWGDLHGPGLVVAASRNGQLLVERSYGLANLEHRIPNTAATRFNAGSVTKVLTAYSLLQLERAGRLDLDDRLGSHLDDLPAELARVTLRQLLQHTAGVKDDWTLASLAGWETSDVRSHEQARRLIDRQDGLNFAAGSAFSYSNSGYILLADVIETVTGRPYADWVADEVLQPLGMDASILPTSPVQVVDGLATPYEMRRAGSRDPRQTHLVRGNVQSNVQGAGNLVTNVADLLRLGEHLLDAGFGESSVLERMQEQALLADGIPSGYGLGLQVGKLGDSLMLHHGGSLSGYRSHLLLLPETGLVVVVLGNVNNIRPAAVGTEIALRLLNPEPVAEAREPDNEAEPLRHAALAESARYRGRYLLESGRMLTVEAAEGRLYMQMGGSLQALLPESENRFVLAGEETPVRFEGGSNGRMARLVLELPEHRLEAKRIDPQPISGWDARQYSGRYYSAALDVHYELSVIDDRLVARRSRGDNLKFNAIGDDRFLEWEPGDLLLTFERNRRGRVQGFSLSANRARDIAFVRQ